MNQARRFRKIRELPPKQLLEVACHKGSRLWRQSVQWIAVGSLGRLASGLLPRHPAEFRSDVRFFALNEWRNNKAALKLALAQSAGMDLDRLRGIADQYCEHCFDLLGSGRMSLGKDIDWHRDFKSGFTWPLIYFKRIREIELANASDIKVPWELSRCYHFPQLGLAYWLTNDEKYAREFVYQCLDWIEKNPPYYGVNWHCAMEVAIRAINWIWAYYMFREASCFDSQAQSVVTRVLYIHGQYIWNNLEFDKRVLDGNYVRHNGNHYISDLVGLIYLGLVLRGDRPQRWLHWALLELDREMQVQVLSDGVHWELSPSYHRLVLELVLPTVILCSLNNVQVPEALKCACEAMAEYTMNYLNPDGFCPLVRDADDGQVVGLDDHEYRDHRHLLALAGGFFNRKDFLSRAGRISGEVVWMLGRSAVERARSLVGPRSRLCSKGFRDSGFYILRNRDDTQVFVACADVGMKGTYGGHAHNDCLSFELYCAGTTFITDSGTFIYSGDPAARNQFRSTAHHNTARIDGTEINRFAETELFGMDNDAKPKVLQWETRPESDYLVAEHYGYSRLSDSVIHRRSFLLDRASNNLLIEDHFDGQGLHLFELFFHFSAGVELEQIDEFSFRARAGGATILLKFSAGKGWSAKIEPTWISQGYGRQAKSSKLVLVTRQVTPATLSTSISLPLDLDREIVKPTARSDSAMAPRPCAKLAV